jgi:hypothetical protein
VTITAYHSLCSYVRQLLVHRQRGSIAGRGKGCICPERMGSYSMGAWAFVLGGGGGSAACLWNTPPSGDGDENEWRCLHFSPCALWMVQLYLHNIFHGDYIAAVL